MLHPCAENSLVSLLRPLYLAPRCRGPYVPVAPGRARVYSTRTSEQLAGGDPSQIQGLKSIAVLGGGITGLASAYYLTRELPHSRVVLFEASEGLGGWIKSKTVDVGNGSVVFEQGPRTLRTALPNGPVTISLICQLGLEDKIIMTPKDSVAYRNRYIYYPNHLVRLPMPPTSIWELIKTLATEPLFRGVPMGVIREVLRPKSQWKIDESIGSFFSRRFGPELVDNILSAVCHGIYAGDVWKLSAKSLFPFAWHGEEKYGGVLMARYRMWALEAEAEERDGSRGVILQKADGEMMRGLRSDMERLGQKPLMDFWLKPEVYSLKGGLETLTKALEDELRGNENVRIETGVAVGQMEPDTATGCIRLTSRCSKIPLGSYNHVISTLPAQMLHSLTPPTMLSTLALTPSVTVMVVNLFYSTPNLSVQGFGYLLPSSIPYDQNPERCLGVVFDSHAAPGLDTALGTKITIMLGGHWWDGWPSYPNNDDGIAMAKNLLARHLGIKGEPVASHVTLQRDCIPQYTVGHHMRMQKALWELGGDAWRGLSVAGAAFNGVGVNDCVRGARDVVKALGKGRPVTGLEGYASDETEWVRTVFRGQKESGGPVGKS
ncbi:MAG: oxygen-dependent protoporphyrinogen oxidase [Geoglossum simile]|nr:MAG: oxygen-dependent protoporphyrinogen oxidase [Geoglossum simile]